MSASTDTASAPGLSRLPWPAIAPLAAWLVFLLTFWLEGPVATTLVAVALVCVVLAAVHHAEVVAHRVGEPFGTLVLAVSVTVIEVSLIVALMFSAGEAAPGLARDTVFAAVMLILTGMVGLSLLAGSVLHGEQAFEQRGVSAALATLRLFGIGALRSLVIVPSVSCSVPVDAASVGVYVRPKACVVAGPTVPDPLTRPVVAVTDHEAPSATAVSVFAVTLAGTPTAAKVGEKLTVVGNL